MEAIMSASYRQLQCYMLHQLQCGRMSPNIARVISSFVAGCLGEQEEILTRQIRSLSPMSTRYNTSGVFGAQPNFIGFCGAGGVGKTTTAKALSAATGLEMLPSASRKVFERMGVKTEDEQNVLPPENVWELQRNIQEAHWTQQFTTALKTKERVICDRTQWDQFTYALLQCSKTISHEDYGWLEGLALGSTAFYTHIILFPFRTYINHNDGMRTNSWGMRNTFQIILEALLLKYAVPHYRVRTETVEDRVQEIAKFCNLPIIAPIPPAVQEETNNAKKTDRKASDSSVGGERSPQSGAESSGLEQIHHRC